MDVEYGDGDRSSAVVRADPALLAETATRLLDIRLTADERCRAIVGHLEVADPAYGDLAESLPAAHRRALAAATGALEALGEAVEADVDRLLRVAFTQREADLAAQDRATAAGRPSIPRTAPAPTGIGLVAPVMRDR
jgi:hypothetical protein